MNKYTVVGSDFLKADMGDDIVVYHLKKNTYVILNETMNIIFESIEETLSESDILDKFMETYDVPLEECKAAIESALLYLEDRKLIQTRGRID